MGKEDRRYFRLHLVQNLDILDLFFHCCFLLTFTAAQHSVHRVSARQDSPRGRRILTSVSDPFRCFPLGKFGLVKRELV